MAVSLPTEIAPRPWLTIGTPRPVAELARTASNMPVVWITEYVTDDDPIPTYTEFGDDTATVMCRCQYSVGRPVIGRQCAIRQRRSILERRCSVCSRKINPGSPMICIGVNKGVVDFGPGDTQEVVTSQEGPAHPACAVYASLTCPQLNHRLDKVAIAVSRDYQVFGVFKAFGEGPERLLPLDDDRARKPLELGAYCLSPIASKSELTTMGDYLRADAPNNANLPTLAEWDARFARKGKGKGDR